MAQAKLHDDTLKVKKTKTPKKRDPNVKHWIEEIVQLRLQMQIEELHKNIQFFKQENEYIRRLAEKCRCLSEDVRGMQQLLSIKDMHSGEKLYLSIINFLQFTVLPKRYTYYRQLFSELTTIQHLQAKYHNEHGIIATLTGMFRGSMNIQQIAAKLLTPFLERWNPRDNIVAADVSSAPGAPQVPSNPPSSVVLDVY
ncbi:uncharacterized protein LOC105836071 isoform X1 [Monomorium pharaonis]|uniref:uncharacterized protein LOC105836071 isoform X1 n=1 Tax=Monomorium pharaonis TaxID=307658 RepID=UPI0017460764|nr:uncharacterized protein LOC105836071 isoform X1 [Monomorium pharaonis]